MKLHVSSFVEGAPALVLGNSLGTNTALWDGHMGWLAKSFNVVRFDYPGHGDEAAPIEEITVEGLARSLHAALASAGISRFHYCGVSLGGAVGIALAAAFPQSVESLVVSNSGAALGSRAFWEARMALVDSFGIEAIADATVSRWVSGEKLAGPTGAWLRQMFTGTSNAGYLAGASAVMEFDGISLLKTVKARTLVIAGSDDAATPAVLGLELANRIKDAAYAELACAHIAPVDASEAFKMNVGRFLSA